MRSGTALLEPCGKNMMHGLQPGRCIPVPIRPKLQGRASIVDKPRLAGYYDDQLSWRASRDNPWDTGQALKLMTFETIPSVRLPL